MIYKMEHVGPTNVLDGLKNFFIIIFLQQLKWAGRFKKVLNSPILSVF